MKLGGLFSGIGGFEEAWRRNGGEVAWMCEVDRKARQVLEARFPGVPIYADVTELDPAEVEPVDVLSGGSPCQGFSMAGARTGLEHGESRLFADHVRIMDGLAERGLKWAVWENVPGVLSIKDDNDEWTFEHVVAALVGADEPVRLSRGARWNTGLADRGGRAVAWRVVDSRHFGVPQRRRRVYAVVAFGGAAADRAGRALLAVPEGVSGDSAACGQEGEELAGTLRASLGGGSAGDSWDAVGHVAACLTAREGKGPDSDVTTTLIPQVAHTLTREGFDASEDGTGRGTPIVPQPIGFDRYNNASTGDVAHTLAAGKGYPDVMPHVLDAVHQPAYGMTGGTGDESAFPEQQPALTASHGQPGNVAVPAVLLTMRERKDGGGKGPLLAEDESLTLATGNGPVLSDPKGIAENQRGEVVATDYAHAITSGGGKPGQGYPAVHEAYGVRRLTPVECERLQGFPDGWTEPAGSDSARYKALGNAVTVNVPEWLFRRMLETG